MRTVLPLCRLRATVSTWVKAYAKKEAKRAPVRRGGGSEDEEEEEEGGEEEEEEAEGEDEGFEVDGGPAAGSHPLQDLTEPGEVVSRLRERFHIDDATLGQALGAKPDPEVEAGEEKVALVAALPSHAPPAIPTVPALGAHVPRPVPTSAR